MLLIPTFAFALGGEVYSTISTEDVTVGAEVTHKVSVKDKPQHYLKPSVKLESLVDEHADGSLVLQPPNLSYDIEAEVGLGDGLYLRANHKHQSNSVRIGFRF
jgi:hypothetical protein